MKYFNLTQEDITVMRILTRKKFLPYLLGFLFSVLIIFICYTQMIKNNNYNFISPSLFLIIITGLSLVLFFTHFIYTTGVIQTVLKLNKKIIYSGILSSKKIKETTKFKRYIFYMDGMKFSVNESDFQSFNLGDLLEFHVSSKGKHLIKITKPSSSDFIKG
jgi:hypothetical protein